MDNPQTSWVLTEKSTYEGETKLMYGGEYTQRRGHTKECTRGRRRVHTKEKLHMERVTHRPVEMVECTYGRVYTWRSVHMEKCIHEGVYLWRSIPIEECTHGGVYTWKSVHM